MAQCCESHEPHEEPVASGQAAAQPAGESVSPRLQVAPEPLDDENEILGQPRGQAARDDIPGAVSSESSTTRQWLQWGAGQLGVPDVWKQDRPSLAKVWYYLRYSEQVPPAGPARVASIAYAYAVIPIIAASYGLAWVSERPARAGVALLTSVVLVIAMLFF